LRSDEDVVLAAQGDGAHRASGGVIVDLKDAVNEGGRILAIRVRAWRIALARGLLPDMSWSWVFSHVSSPSKAGSAPACLIAVGLSGGNPRAAFSTA